MSKTLSGMRERNRPTEDAYASANSTVSGCLRATLHVIEHERSQRMEREMKSKASDPVFMGKLQLAMMKYAQATQAAQKSNDAAAMAKAQMDMQHDLLGVDIHAEMKKDTSTTDAKCGTPVARPAVLADQDALQMRIAAIDGRLRSSIPDACDFGSTAHTPVSGCPTGRLPAPRLPAQWP
jgi:hypothetical protein